jgi:hypothetical protein
MPVSGLLSSWRRSSAKLSSWANSGAEKEQRFRWIRETGGAPSADAFRNFGEVFIDAVIIYNIATGMFQSGICRGCLTGSFKQKGKLPKTGIDEFHLGNFRSEIWSYEDSENWFVRTPDLLITSLAARNSSRRAKALRA